MVLVRLILLVLTMAFAGAPDALGNMRVRTEGTTSVSTMNYADGTNRVTSATIFGQNRTFSYDARGNVTNNGKYSFAYDFANQPVSQTGTVNATYAYDGNFKRVKEVSGGKTIYNIYSRLTGALLYRDQATDVVKTDYVSVGGAALRLKKTGTGSAVPDYSHFDAQGSVVADTRTQGVVLWRESYEPFGRSRINPAANADDTGYTGHLADKSTDLVYMQARYYDPLIGRFLSTDPVGYQDQLNLYAYVHNDPINRIDPNGETDIYIGGAGDSQTRIVQSYAAAQAKVGDRAVGYFNQGDKAGVVAFAKANAGNGEPLNIIGHSYGATTAVSATKALAKDGVAVDNLVGVDGVKKPFQGGGLGKAEGSVGNVVGVNSTGGGTSGDAIEGAGKALGAVTTLGGRTPGAFKPGNADLSITANTSHEDFAGAFTAAGSDGLSAKDIIDDSYRN